MSPGAVDVRSTVNTIHSSHQNPISAPSPPNKFPDNHQEGVRSSIFRNASEFSTVGGLASQNGSRTRTVVSGRSRPRFVKLRKQLHGRYRVISGEFRSDFNPFHSVSENLDCATVSTVSNGFLEKHDIGSGGNDVSNKGFVFGASRSQSALNMNSKVNLDSGEREFCGNMEGLGSKVGSMKFGNVGFVFRAKQQSENEGKPIPKTENLKLHDVGFTFGVSENFDLQKRELSEIHLNPGSSAVENVTLCSECADGTNLELNLNFKNGESSVNAARSDFDNFSSVFGVTNNDPSKYSGLSGSSFMFGSSWSNSVTNLKEGKTESGNSVFYDTRGMKVECEIDPNKVRDTGSWKEDDYKGVFVSGSSASEYLVKNKQDDVSSMNETFQNCNGIENLQNSFSESGINDMVKLSSCINSENVASASLDPVFNLPDGIRKLNIDGFENVDGAKNKKSSPNDDGLYVFRSHKEGSFSSTGISDATGRESKLEDLCDAAKRTDDSKFESNEKIKSYNVTGSSVGISSSESFAFQEGLVRRLVEGQTSKGQVGVDAKFNEAAAASSLFSSSEAPTFGVGMENVKSYTSTVDALDISFADLTTPSWDPSCLKASLFPELNKKLGCSIKSKSKKDKKTKTVRRKFQQPSMNNQQSEQDGATCPESSARESLNSPESYSPMDVSPYEETMAANQSAIGTSVMSNNCAHLGNEAVPSVSRSMVAAGPQDGEELSVNKSDKLRELKEDNLASHSQRCSFGDHPSKGFIFGAEMECSSSKAEHICNVGIASAGATPTNKESNHQIQFCFASGLEDIDGTKISFSASSSAHGSSSLAKRLRIKNNRRKASSEQFNIAPNPNTKDQGDLSTAQGKGGNRSEANEQVKQSSISSDIAIQEACETWRLRGNQAYKNGDLPKAEDFYTRGINSIPSTGMPSCCLKPLVICYSNRAATRMSLGNLREALRDCEMAATLDPKFLKVQMRAANCHLVLGEVKNALQYYNICLEAGAAVCLDRRITIEAAEGLQKAQKVADCIARCAKLLEERTSDAAFGAIDFIADALSISPYAERLLEMKAEFLFMLREYEEVIQLCEQTLCSAEKNFVSMGLDVEFVDISHSGSECSSFPKLWRWHLTSKSYFYLGRLEVALDSLQKLEQIGSTNKKHVNKILESSVSLAGTIRDLLRHKSAGNEAVRSGRYKEAIEHYTAALSSNVESRPFSAICFCNRAAAHQALGQIADAVADCSLAMALDGSYSKAVSRRAMLHEMIRDYRQAASDLQKLVSILENQSHVKARRSGTPSKSISGGKELRQAQRQLSLMEEEAKKGLPLNLYLILGVKECDSVSDIKKAYRKAALRHHPDKAGQFLARSESGDEGQLWKEIFEEVHKDADRLFKMIGEAYTILSDTNKRSEYDLDEEIRKAAKQNNGSRPHRRTGDSHSHSYPFERGDNRQNWQDNWKTYGNSHYRW